MLGEFIAFLSIWFLTVLASFLPNQFLQPNKPVFFFSQKQSIVLLHSLLVSAVFLSITLIVQRPIFSALAVLIFLIILVVVSNAKLNALREPLVYSDIAMFSQAFKHPRLYFPFIGLLPLLLFPIIIVVLIITVLSLESAMSFTWTRILLTLGFIFFCIYHAKKVANRFRLTQEPAKDNQQFCLLNALFIYSIQASSETHQQKVKQVLDSSPFSMTSRDDLINASSYQNQQHITVVQSESFFDARRLHPSIKSDVLKYYDQCLRESVQYGQLNVPAWGANTMRTEFSFLAGLQSEDLGLYRYYPYQYLHKTPIASIASHLKKQGFYCVCIHPHPASFFGRDRMFPQLGFDEFVDIDQFDNNDTFGPYISDQAVTDKILDIQKQHDDKNLFIFAITMENHGPLHLEKTTNEEHQTYFSKKPLEELNDLTVYLRHLKNADTMIEQLTTAFKQSDVSQKLCFYGDHIPSMPNIYEHLDYHNKHSDYFIWQNYNLDDIPPALQKSDIEVAKLGEALLYTHQSA